MRKMTIGSLFDGSGAFPLAGCISGMEPLWASEIEPYPIAVTKTRFPRMKHLGDVQKINGAEIDPVDVITFGSPCQDMSIAGKRAGLRHEENGDEQTTRSGLFIEAIRIIREMREATNGKYPAFAVWENVPGAFSSNGGADFKTVLEELASVAQGERVSVPFPEKRRWLNAGEIVGDGFSIAWRVLDAQYWGVPQRRKRIYLVADFAGGRAGKILFEREGGCGNPEPGEEARQGAADHASGGAGRSGRVECLNPWDAQTIRQYGINGVYPALLSNSSGGQNRSGVCYAIDSMSSNSMKSNNPHSGFHEEKVAKTIQAIGVDPTCNQGGNVIVMERCAAFMGGQGSKAGGLGYAEEIAPTIKSVMSGGNTVPDVVYALQGNGIDRADTAGCNGKGWKVGTSYTLNTIDRPAVAYAMQGFGDYKECGVASSVKARDYKDATDLVCGVDCRNMNEYPELYPTLQAKPNGGQSLNYSGAVRVKYIVRRLTPLECCRLQGFPDGWGDIPCPEIMTDADAEFWEDVRRTYAGAMGKVYRPFKDKDALVKWYNKLHTDSAEYKMWGNGIALPCAAFVMQGIAECVSAMG